MKCKMSYIKEIRLLCENTILPVLVVPIEDRFKPAFKPYKRMYRYLLTMVMYYFDKINRDQNTNSMELHSGAIELSSLQHQYQHHSSLLGSRNHTHIPVQQSATII